MIHVHSSWRQTSGMQTSGSDTSHSVCLEIGYGDGVTASSCTGLLSKARQLSST